MNNTRRKTLGRKVMTLRKDRGLSQLDFAARMGVDPDTLSRIENGRSNITLSTLEKLADGLDLTLSELFEDSLRPSENLN